MCDYFGTLQETIEREAEQVLENTLCQQLAGDLADEIAGAVVDSEKMSCQVRYVLINRQTLQAAYPFTLEKREYAEALLECNKDREEMEIAVLVIDK